MHETVLGILVALLVGSLALAFAQWPANAVERQAASSTALEPVEIAQVTDNIQFAIGPRDDIPPGLQLGYGFYDLITPIAVVFDELVIRPSSERQTYVAYTSDDADAAALAMALQGGSTDELDYGFRTAFSDSVTGGISYPGRLAVPEATVIDYFTMTVPAFRLELKDSTSPFGTSTKVSVVTDNDWDVTIRAFGRPLWGDVNRDWQVNSLDALLMLQLAADLKDAVPFPEVADAQPDGVLDARDARIVLDFSAHLVGGIGKPNT
jgi:hypothetical protein